MDAIATSFFMENFPIFKHILPNFITLTGLLLNFIIYFGLKNRSFNLSTVFVLIMLRWLIDDLDGATARKYDKVTQLGGYLDTISDFIFFMLMYDFFITEAGLPRYLDLIFLVVYWYVIYYYDCFSNHDGLKVYGSYPSWKDILPFIVNHAIITYLLIFIAISTIY